MEWIVQLPILFFSIMIHEVSHGLVALRNGDDTAARAGRLTFNPVAHVDPLGTLFLPLFCLFSHLPLVGWAKPVPVNPSLLVGRRWALFRVAFAGPASNLALSLLAALLFKTVASLPALFPHFQGTVLNALLFAVSVNIFLAYFNLVPIHPLDGSKVLSALLPFRYRIRYERHMPYGFMIILFLIALGLLKTVVIAPAALTLDLFARLGLIW